MVDLRKKGRLGLIDLKMDKPVYVSGTDIFVFGNEVTWDQCREMQADLGTAADVAEAYWIKLEAAAIKQEIRQLRRTSGVTYGSIAAIIGMNTDIVSKVLNLKHTSLTRAMRWRLRSIRNGLEHSKALIRVGQAHREITK